MTAPTTYVHKEHTNSAGEVLLSFRHIALLHGLYDRPDGVASSQIEWAAASVPYLRRFGDHRSLGHALGGIETINPAWIERRRCGRRIEAKLTDRGAEGTGIYTGPWFV